MGRIWRAARRERGEGPCYRERRHGVAGRSIAHPPFVLCLVGSPGTAARRGQDAARVRNDAVAGGHALRRVPRFPRWPGTPSALNAGVGSWRACGLVIVDGRASWQVPRSVLGGCASWQVPRSVPGGAELRSRVNRGYADALELAGNGMAGRAWAGAPAVARSVGARGRCRRVQSRRQCPVGSARSVGGQEEVVAASVREGGG